mgnify:CR=1 FL=1
MIMTEISDNIIVVVLIIIIIITVKVDISTNLDTVVRRRLLDQPQENAWLVSIANTKNTIIALDFIFWKTKIK